MERFDAEFGRQIENCEARYKGDRREDIKGDWRSVESGERVHRRMMALGLDELAGRMIASEHVTERVESATRADSEVSLLERIIEENDLLESRFLHIGSTMAQRVGRILIREGGRTVGFGSGFLMAPRLIMTNNHVINEPRDARESAIEFDFFEREDGRTGPTKIFALDPDAFFVTDQNLDYTIIAIQERSSDGVPLGERGWVSLIPESGKALVGEPVNIIQHPSGAAQKVAIKNNHIVARVDDFLHYVTDTEPGSSGSPVFNMQWQLAALHHSGVPRRNDQGQILLRDGSIWDGSRDTVALIEWVANEGVRISSIVAHVRNALRGEVGPARDMFEQGLEIPRAPERSSATIPLQMTISHPVGGVPRPSLIAENEIDDETLDRLTSEEIASMMARVEERSLDVTLEAARPGESLVAEGDSWFDYSPAGLDIIACLKRFYDYRIHNVSEAGDIVDNMAWGSKHRRWRRTRPPLEETIEAIQRHRPRIVLLSGGGNDIAGDELLSFLNHKDSGLPPLRQPYTDCIIKDYFRRGFMHIMNRIWSIDPSIRFITHGYGHAVPDGRAVIRLLGFSFVGPWLRPALTAKGYESRAERESVIHSLIDLLNQMLADLAGSDSRIHYLDLRPLIGKDDWENELHLRNSAYRRIAGKYHDLIRRIG